MNPRIPAELVADHSIIADVFGRPDARDRNVELEYARNSERYRFLKWGQTAFDRFRIVPRAWGSCTRSTSSTWPGWWRSAATGSTRMCAWAPTRTPPPT